MFKGKEALATCGQTALHEGCAGLLPRGSGGPALHVPVCAGLTGPRFETGCHCVTRAAPVPDNFQVLKGAF